MLFRSRSEGNTSSADSRRKKRLDVWVEPISHDESLLSPGVCGACIPFAPDAKFGTVPIAAARVADGVHVALPTTFESISRTRHNPLEGSDCSAASSGAFRAHVRVWLYPFPSPP